MWRLNLIYLPKFISLLFFSITFYIYILNLISLILLLNIIYNICFNYCLKICKFFSNTFFRGYPNNIVKSLHQCDKSIAFVSYVTPNRAEPSVYMVAAELCCRPISKSANQSDYGRVSRVSNSDTTASKEREYLAWEQTSKHTSSTHTSADSFGLTLSRAHTRIHHARASKIPMERPMTGMTCTRCRTEDPSRSSSPLLLVLPPVRRLRSGSLGLPSPREVRA